MPDAFLMCVASASERVLAEPFWKKPRDLPRGVLAKLFMLTKNSADLRKSDSVLSKTAILPKKEGRKREISNESARGSSLREANVYVSAKGAPRDGQDTVKTLRTIIWYKRACIRQTTRQPFSCCPNLYNTNGRQQKCRYERLLN